MDVTTTGARTAHLLDGRRTAASIRKELHARVSLLSALGREPGLGTVLVGADPASAAYVAGKHRDCAEIGIQSLRVELPATVTTADVLAEVDALNADPACTGMIVQLPLPPQVDRGTVLERIAPEKDADGLHPVNLGRLVIGAPAPLPCTPRGILELLRRYCVPLTGADVTIVGCGVTVGRPLALLLTRETEAATVTMCHQETRDVATHVRRADIVVAAAGAAGIVASGDVKPGAVVLDVGITRTEAGILGDVDDEVATVARMLAPMPGGVGPMTRAMLMTNVVDAAEREASLPRRRLGA